MSIITAEHLTKRYGNFVAVNGISFEVQEGEVFGILGPNGAGKTTTLEMIEGLKAITSGQVTLAGFDVAKHARQVKSLIGVQLQSSSFFEGLNLKELLEVFGAMYGRQVSGMHLLKEVELVDKAKSQVKELSGGQKQRFSIAVALVNDPKVIFLDEPTTGLDPQARRHLWELVKTINGKGKTVVLTTHYMEEAEVLCDRVAIMDTAKIIALDTPKNLLRHSGLRSTIQFRTDHSASVEELKSLPGVADVAAEDHGYRLMTSEPQVALPALFEHSAKNGYTMFDLHMRQPTLEDVFLKLTGHALRE